MIYELKRCPFCGGTPDLYRSNDPDGNPLDDFGVECVDCGADLGTYDSPVEAMNAWNRRVTHACTN